MTESDKRHLPPWFKRRLVGSTTRHRTEEILRQLGLNTVCDSAHCPNRGECYDQLTATIMILGDRCTRDCRFCAVRSDPPLVVDADEPVRVAEAVEQMGLRYAVITSVTRDDLSDGGAEHFVHVLDALRKLDPAPVVELLTPDFAGNQTAWEAVARARPDVWGHNVEMAPRLYPEVRPQADYARSLGLLAWIKERSPDITTKSAFMIGVGETRDEIVETCRDLRRVGVDLLVLGQYLAPSRNHWPVKRFYAPDEFAELEREIKKLGFAGVMAEPCARSSYRAEAMYRSSSPPKTLRE